jgi:hypothetical protein
MYRNIARLCDKESDIAAPPKPPWIVEEAAE